MGQPDRTPQPSSISSDPETSQTPVSTGGSETSAAVVPAPNSTMSSGAGPSGLTAGAISSRLLSSNTGEDDQKVSGTNQFTKRSECMSTTRETRHTGTGGRRYA